MHGIGTDILAIGRIRPLENQWDDPFFMKAYTEKERIFCLGRSDPVTAFAEAFSAKEAVFKSLGMPADLIRLDQIEILRDPDGKPTVTLHPPLREKAAALGITRICLSISYERDYVVAFAVSE